MDHILDFINPIDESLQAYVTSLPKSTLGKAILLHKKDFHLDFTEGSVVLLGVPEGRTALKNIDTGKGLNIIREQLYQLYVGNWNVRLYDLGDIKIGHSFQDTEAALKSVLAYLLKKKLIPIVIGGSQALTYAAYRAYDELEQKVNLSVVDAKFDLGNFDKKFDSANYLTKIVMEKPNNLFNFTNIGFQTFLNAQEEIDLVKNMLFDAYRLGSVKSEIEIVEPVMRDTDLLSIDLGAIRRMDAPGNQNAQLSGFNADDICKITRYAGLSDKLSVMGIFEYNVIKDKNYQTAELIAQMIWYFIEGVNFRAYEFPTLDLEYFQKYMVVIEDETYNFYKSNKSGRWWMEINVINDNKLKRQTLIPCTYKDYLTANKQEIPDRWYTNRKKLE